MKEADMNTKVRFGVGGHEKDGFRERQGMRLGLKCCIHLQNCRITNLTNKKRICLLKRQLVVMNWAWIKSCGGGG